MSQFCPECHTLLLTEVDEETKSVHLKCPNCVYKQEITGQHMLYSMRLQGGAASHVPYGTIFDSAVKRSARVACRNEACPSLDPEQRGRVNDAGIVIQPDVVIINYNDPEERRSTYICRICGTMFR